MERELMGSNTVEGCHQQSPGLENPELKEQIAKPWMTRFCDICRVGRSRQAVAVRSWPHPSVLAKGA